METVVGETDFRGVVLSMDDLISGKLDFAQKQYGGRKIIDMNYFNRKTMIWSPCASEAFNLGRIVFEEISINPSYRNKIIVDIESGNAIKLGSLQGVVLQPKQNQQKEAATVKSKEGEATSQNGNLVTDGRDFYYINNNRRFRVMDRDKFIRNTGFRKSPTAISSENLRGIPEGLIAKEFVVFDYAGKEKRNSLKRRYE